MKKNLKNMMRLFGCTKQQATAQAEKNLKGLQEMHAEAASQGKKVNGYTADELAFMVAKFKRGWGL